MSNVSSTTSIVLLPVHVLVFLILHFAQASYRLFQLIRSILHSSSPHPQSEGKAAESITADLQSKRWSKTPKHLAVIFVQTQSESALIEKIARFLGIKSSNTWLQGEEEALDKLIQETEKLTRWCTALGIKTLSIYDKEGIMDRNAQYMEERMVGSMEREGIAVTGGLNLSRSDGFSSILIPQASAHSQAQIQTAIPLKIRLQFEDDKVESTIVSEQSTLFSDHSGPKNRSSSPSSNPDLDPETLEARDKSNDISNSYSWSDQYLRVNFLSKLAGRQQLVHVAKDLKTLISTSDSNPNSNSESLISDFKIQEIMSASSLSEPDLILVLGGPYCRLHGFPPWQIRLSEISHHASPYWLPPPRLTYWILRDALDLYGGAEMRLGR